MSFIKFDLKDNVLPKISLFKAENPRSAICNQQSIHSANFSPFIAWHNDWA